MSILGSFNREPSDRSAASALLSQVSDEYPVTSLAFGPLDVAVHRSPEVSLMEVSGAVGSRQAVVVLGYVTVPGVESSDMAGHLLKEWREQGPRFLGHLDGSFSLLLADEAAGELLLAVDCLSSRTMWTSIASGGLVFGSHVEPVATLARCSRELDRAYLYSFLVHAQTIDSRSPYRGVTAIDSGCAVLMAEHVQPETVRYYEPRFTSEPLTEDEGAEVLLPTLRQILADAVVGSQDPCLFLSGGLDSRLLASVSPPGMSAVTFCDQENRETRLATRVAAVVGMPHRLIVRPESWYPDDLEAAARANDGIWSVKETHYLPLRQPSYEFHKDVVVLGFGSNTYFRGNHLAWPELWRPVAPNSDLQRRLIQLVRMAPSASIGATEFLSDKGRQDCREAFEAVTVQVAERVSRYSGQLPDLWELFWSGTMTTVPQAANLACLRDFTAERNAFSDRRIHQLYLSLRPPVRASGTVVRKALARSSRQLNWLADSNTWLPMALPRWVHRSAASTRTAVSRARQARLGATKSADYRSRGSWPHYGILMSTNPTMRRKIEGILTREWPTEDLLDRDRIRGCWAELGNGQYRNADSFAALLTMLLFLLPEERMSSGEG